MLSCGPFNKMNLINSTVIMIKIAAIVHMHSD
jgi:hypothetical protein